jgi:D-alanine-D-alanine ligase
MSDDEIPLIKPGIHDLAVIYCVSNAYSGAREIERLADEEIIEVATAVKAGLETFDYRVDMVQLDPDNIGGLSKYGYIFNLVETIYGFPLADHEVAQQLEYLGIPFTGSSSQTLKTCLNKAATKKALKANKITTPAYMVIEPGDKLRNELHYPVIVKPVHEDGCVGISVDSRVMNLEQLEKQIKKIHEVYQQAALVEEFIEGRDITASIIGNDAEARLLPLTGITYAGQDSPGHLTFDANWVSGSNEYQDSRSSVIEQLDEQLQARIQTLALSAYHVMDCCDYARVDFRVRGNVPYVLEVNPNPCINPDGAGFVKSASAAGFTYPDLIRNILEMSIRHHQLTFEKKAEKVLAL